MKTFKPLYPAIDREVLKAELTQERYLCKTNKANREIYCVDAHNSPNVMKEIGRLRELTFREAGGGTGKEMDVDNYDNSLSPFYQLFVWDPEDEEIVGGYRYITGDKIPIDKDGNVISATAKLFHFTEKFRKDYMPYIIELGRSFVQPNYQPQVNRQKGLFALDNLWDGLGSLIIRHPVQKYFFGKITMYPHFDSYCRDLILAFMQYYFPDEEKLVYPVKPLVVENDYAELAKNFTEGDYDKDYKILQKMVRDRDMFVPPLVNQYMSLSNTMKTFGTSLNNAFGEVEETGIMVSIDDIYDHRRNRYTKSYLKGLEEAKLK